MPEDLLILKDVATLLRLGEKTVYLMAWVGAMPASRFGSCGASRAHRSPVDQLPAARW